MRCPKLILLCIYLFTCSFFSLAQVTQSQPATRPGKIDPFSIRQMDSLMMSRERNSNIPQHQLDVRSIKQSGNGKRPLKRQNITATTGKPLTLTNRIHEAGSSNLVCSVISGRDFLQQDSLILWSRDPSMLPDGNLVVSGQYGDYANLPSFNTGAFCMKTTVNGEMIWGVLLDSADERNDYMNLSYSLPLQNGDILLAGRTSNPVYRNDDFVMVRLDGNGNLRWLKTYQSRYWQGFNGSGDFLKIADLDEDAVTGDIYFTTSHWFGNTTVTKVAGTNGAVSWSRTYKRWYTDTPFGLELKDTSMVLFSLGYDNSNSQYISAQTLRKSTGDTVTVRLFKEIRNGYGDPGVYNTYRSRKTDNGHFLLSGPTTRYWEWPVYTGTIDLYHASVVELDENLNFVKSYGFKNRIESNAYNTKVSHFADGRGVFTMMKYISGYIAQTQISLFKDDTIYHKRLRSHINEGLPYEPVSLQLGDGGILNAKLMGDSTVPVSNGTHIDFYRAHTSDTASACMGMPDTSTKIWYRNFERIYWHSSDSVTSNVFSESIPKTYTVHRFASHREPGCVVTSNCDSLNMSISPQQVCLGSTAVLTIHRNSGCGSLVPLSFDTTAIDQATMINDSSYLLHFNAAGTFIINGSLQGCTIIRDSLQVTVLPAPGPVNIGADTSLCAGNSIVLHAGNLYAAYSWQDGSTDSVLTVYTPGTYHVQVLDACGNSYSDTLVVVAANFPFSVGADKIKCNADTLLLSATPGFTNYQWQNNYRISNTTGANVSVYPLVDTFYYASAEKWPGCVVRDTIRITVNTSPVINLGADTSLCAGQSLVLTAGAGFANYSWNTGASLERITVNQAGLYHVVATAANGCISYDTLALLQVNPFPVFTLGADTTLCSGQTLQLNITLPNATYQWQDAGNGNAYTISQAGLYTLAVTQRGCTTRDSLQVAYKPSPVVQLGRDSLLCIGQVLTLDAGNPGASYQWQDGTSNQQLVQSRSGTYRVSVNLHGCMAADTISIRFDPTPFFSLGKDSSICAGNSLVLIPQLNTIAQYLWQDGSTAPNITVTKAGLYSLSATNHCGSYTDSLLLTEGLCRLLMPNAFTPNNDGVNDVFRVKYPFAVKRFSFVIFNRYGQPVYETNDISKGWDGTFKSSPQDNGAYTWVIRLKNNDDSEETQSGTVLLLR